MVRELADALHQRGRVVHMHRQVFPDASALPSLDKLTAELQPPYIVKITPAGAVEQIYPE